MDNRFNVHNSHWNDSSKFRLTDPHLVALSGQALIYESPLISQLPANTPGIYSLTGGRQIGKTTLIKQWMAKLISDGIEPTSIAYLTGELIDDHHSLVRLLSEFLETQSGRTHIIADEITYIKDWDRGVKFLADAGLLNNTTLLLTGSDSVIIREARTRYPGRRGDSSLCDFHMYPLSFYEYVALAGQIHGNSLDQLISDANEISAENVKELENAFISYLSHGGFLTAINDIAETGKIRPATYATYSDWIRGDVLKRHKHEHYLREILTGIIHSYGSQVTWNSLSRSMSIDHPMTVADYITLLSRMDAVFVQAAIREDRLRPAPKKAKKVMFSDPFIFCAISHWLGLPYDQTNPELLGKLVEACATTHYQRFYPTYYIKSKAEIDIAYVDNDRFHPVEIKWTSQLRPESLKQLKAYKNSKVLTRQYNKQSTIHGIKCEYLPLNLLRLGPSPAFQRE